MPKKTDKKKMGRPKLEFDFDLFENLCEIQCTIEEISHILGLSEDTINRRCKEKYGLTFAGIYATKKSFGKASLRRIQIKHAKKGNAALLIWLGKQQLGQKDKQEIEHTGNVLDNLLSAIDGKTKVVSDE